MDVDVSLVNPGESPDLYGVFGSGTNTSEAEDCSSCLSRAWQWIKPKTPSLCVRGIFATASLTGFVVSAFFTAQQFLQDERNHVRAMLYGTGLGLSLTVLGGSVLPTWMSGPIADWCARWSFEGLQIMTQFYLNGGCPIDGNGFWDPTKVPLAVKELAMIIFTGVSVNIALLSLRTLLFPPESQDEDLRLVTINEEEEPVAQDLYIQDPEPIPLLESGRNNKKWLALEQFVKVGLGVTLLGLSKGGVLTAPQALYCGYYLLGHVGGVGLGKVYQYIKSAVEEKCPVQKSTLEKVNKIGRFINGFSYALFFAFTDSAVFIPFGIINGISKTLTQHNFELLTKNDEEVTPFEWKRVDNIAKGALGVLFLSWYISGMTDVGMTWVDQANIITYLATTVLSYPLTRYLAAEFDPRQNNRLFNTLRFYFVNNPEVLMLPYMLIRSAQNIGDDQKHHEILAIVQNFIAWASLGTSGGVNRALMGMRSHRSPNEMSQLGELIAWYILGSQGKFR